MTMSTLAWKTRRKGRMFLPEETDDRIIALLQEDAELTYRELAGKLQLNESTVRKRILALRKKRIIRRFLADIDAAKLGYKSNVMVGVDVDPSMIMEVGSRLATIPEARYVFSTSGENDFQVIIWARSRESMARIVDQIGSIKGVVRVTPNFVLEKLK